MQQVWSGVHILTADNWMTALEEQTFLKDSVLESSTKRFNLSLFQTKNPSLSEIIPLLEKTTTTSLCQQWEPDLQRMLRATALHSTLYNLKHQRTFHGFCSSTSALPSVQSSQADCSLNYWMYASHTASAAGSKTTCQIAVFRHAPEQLWTSQCDVYHLIQD